MYDMGYSHSQINNFRSTVSTTAPWYNGVPLGKSELVCRLMDAIERERPPQPRYDSTWNLQTLFDYVKSLGPNSQLSLPVLREKCVTLLKITMIARSSDIDKIKFSTIEIDEERMCFQMNRPKNFRKGDPGQISISRLSNDEDLCPVVTLLEYLERTSGNHRPNDKIFLSVRPPYKEIDVQTIAKDTLRMMEKAGIDISKFKAHSTRSASSSRAIDLGVSVDEVMEQGRWKSRSVFQRFYNRSQKKRNFTDLLIGGIST